MAWVWIESALNRDRDKYFYNTALAGNRFRPNLCSFIAKFEFGVIVVIALIVFPIRPVDEFQLPRDAAPGGL